MKKWCSVLLAFVLLLSLSACKKDGGSTPSVLGTWEGSLDYGIMLGAQMPIEVKANAPVSFTFTFYEDNRYTRTVDQESLADAIYAMADACIDSISEMYQELGLSLEELLAAKGVATLEDLREELLASAELEAAFRLTIAKHTAYYKYESGKICFAETKKAFDEETYIECWYVDLVEDKMTVTDMEVDGEKYSETASGMFPAVFSKMQTN